MLLVLWHVLALSRLDRPQRRLNFLNIIADDMGAGDVPCVAGGHPLLSCDVPSFGHPYSDMPNLAQLQHEGARFLSAYTLGITCSPSRAALMTGRIPRNQNVDDQAGLKHPSVTEVLCRQGYATAHFGKWNIGKAPNKHAMPEVGTYCIQVVGTQGWPNGTQPQASRVAGRFKVSGVEVEPRWYGRDGGTFDLAIHWLRHVATRPFYMNVWPETPHRSVPQMPPNSSLDHPDNSGFPRLREHFRYLWDPNDSRRFDAARFSEGMRRSFAVNHACRNGRVKCSSSMVTAFVERELPRGMATYLGELWGLDAHIGRLLSAVDEVGARNNTVVLFSSDHGPEQTFAAEVGSTGLCRGGKQSLLEGGLRLPYIVRWPGHIPAGYVDTESLVSSMDWFPTIAALAHVPGDSLPRFDGINIAEQWLGRAGPRVDGALWVWHRPHQMAIRGVGPLKLALTDTSSHSNRRSCSKLRAMYDVVHDPGEKQNLVNQTAMLRMALADLNATWKCGDLWSWINSCRPVATCAPR